MWKKSNEPRKVNYVWVLAGIYLFYLAFKIVTEMLKGTAEMMIWKFLISGAFALIGIYLCLREWKIYRYGSKDQGNLDDELPDSYYNNIEDNFADEADEFENDQK